MCGIVGYVGHQQALDVVIEGLRRLEYRGYDSAGVAILDGDGGARRRRSKAGKLANLEKVLAEHPLPCPAPPASGTPAGPPTAAPTTATPTRTCRLRRRGRRGPQRHHRELRRAARRARGGAATSWPARPTPRSSPTCSSRAGYARRPRRRPCARSAAGSRARSPWSPSHARRARTSWSAPGATRRWWSASARARTSSPATSPLHRAHPRGASSSARTRSSSCARDGVTVTDFDGAPVEGEAFHVDWDVAAAEKGGYDYFMLKEIAEQPEAVADTLLGRLGADGRLQLDEVRITDEDLRDGRQGRHRRLRHRYHAGLIAKYAIEHWTRIPCEVELASEFRYRDPILTARHAGHRDQPDRRDRRHPDGAAARPRAAGPGARDLQHQRLDDPARVRRGALHPRRPRDRGRLHQGAS